MSHGINSVPSPFYLITLHSSKKNRDLIDKTGALRSDIRRNIDYSIVSEDAWKLCKKDYDTEIEVNDVYEVFISFSCNGLSFKNLYVHGVERVFDVIQTLFVNKTFGIDYFKEMFEIKYEKKVIDPNVNFEYFGDSSKKIVLFVEKRRQIKDESAAILESSIISDELDMNEYLLSDLSKSSSLKSYFDNIKFYENIYTIKNTDDDLFLRSHSLSIDRENIKLDEVNKVQSQDIEIDGADTGKIYEKNDGDSSEGQSNTIENDDTSKNSNEKKQPSNSNLNISRDLGSSVRFSDSIDVKNLNQTKKENELRNNEDKNDLFYQNSNLSASCPTLSSMNEIPQSHLKLFNKINTQKCLGIPNIGNSCYLNSSIQCLNNCGLFSNFFFIYNSILRRIKTDGTPNEVPFLELSLNKEYQKNAQIISAWSDFLTHLKINLNLTPRLLKFLIGKKNPTFSNNGEQDAAEFIEAILTYLHEGLCYNKDKLFKFLATINPNSEEYEEFHRLILKNFDKISANENRDSQESENTTNYDSHKEFKRLINQEKSIISELFYGMSTNTFECQTCKLKKYKSDLMMFLPLPIPNRINYHSSCILILNDLSVPKKILIPLSYSVSEAIEYTKVEYEIHNSILAIEYDDTYPMNVLPLSKSIASIKNRIVFFEFDMSEDYALCHLYYIKYFFYKKKIASDFIVKIKDLKSGLFEKLQPFLDSKITLEAFLNMVEIKKIENNTVLNIPTYTVVLKDMNHHFNNLLNSLSPCFTDKKDDISLTDCLNHHFKEEIIDYNCDSCKTNTKYKMKSKLTKLPKYLIIHLKRFSYHSNNTKINTFIDFPENCLRIFGSKYKLTSTANHIEIGMGYGHYMAYIKKADGWYCCNDSVISRSIVPDKATAYILFYEKFE